ncbi:Flp family type IVb pilin [Parendozoicomonas haliclonae]|uniref:Flp/Fap pilin component n=2 Tax=Parendozoicomonas haliclonae TaxID=1960125 RepID=A0A1X7AKQ2_9GAMM|nr:Flp/Fap pilin component [Parendozoicomonas haliclonae]
MIGERLTALYIKSWLFLDQLKSDQRGVTAIEYALVAVAIAAVVGVVFSADGTNSLKGALQGAMQRLSNQLSGAGS